MVRDSFGRIIKIGAIVYGIDPLGNVRVLLRHNKPYDGKHRDEWTFVWGAVEEGETLEQASKREVFEEFGLSQFTAIQVLPETTEFKGLHGISIAHYCTLLLPDIEVSIRLNEESIGYDWVKIEDTKKLLRPVEVPLLRYLAIKNTK